MTMPPPDEPLPPYARLLGLSLREVDGRTLFVMPFADAVMGRPGFLHGGAIAGMLEFAAVAALRQALDDESLDNASVETKPVGVTIDFLRGGAARESFAHGRIKRLGRRIANIEASAWQEDEARPIATARMNVLLERRF